MAAAPLARDWRGLGLYGIAHFGKSLLWNVSAMLFAFFLTEAAGLAPERMGAVLGASLAFNAVADLSFGRLLGRQVRDARAAARAQLLGALAAAVAFSAFAATGLAPAEHRLAYGLATIFAFRLAYSLYDVPQNAFMAFVAPDDRARAVYASTRYVAAGASILLIAAAFAPFVREADEAARALRFAQLCALCAAASVACSALLLLAVPRALPRSVPAAAPRPPAGPDVFLLAVAAIFCLSLTSPAFNKVEAYFAAYALDDAWAAPLFLASAALGKVAGQPLWSWRAARRSLERAFAEAALAMTAACAAFLAFALAGWAGAVGAAFLFGVAWGGMAMAVWGLLARAAARDPRRTTARYGLFTFASKSAQALSILAIGAALERIPYRAPGDGALPLTAFMALTPLTGALLCLGLLAAWRARRPATGTVPGP